MLNRVILQGNLTRDPELKYTPSGNAVCHFGVACNNKYGQREETYFADCVAWMKTAEFIAEHLKKGEKVIIEGRLVLNEWEDKEGNKRSKTQINVDKTHFVGGGSKKTESSSSGESESEPVACGVDGVPF